MDAPPATDCLAELLGSVVPFADWSYESTACYAPKGGSKFYQYQVGPTPCDLETTTGVSEDGKSCKCKDFTAVFETSGNCPSRACPDGEFNDNNAGCTPCEGIAGSTVFSTYNGGCPGPGPNSSICILKPSQCAYEVHGVV